MSQFKPKNRFTIYAIIIGIGAFFARPIRPVAACEIAIPPNYLYRETYDFDESRLPLNISVSDAAPEWVAGSGLVGFLQLVNNRPDDVYLLFASDTAGLKDGEPVDAAVSRSGMIVGAGETFDLYGEASFSQYAPGLKMQNINNIGGSASAPDDLPPTQTGQLYLVADQRLTIVPFTLSYEINPAYQPEGTFKTVTLPQKVEQVTAIVLGEALQEAGYDGKTSTTVRVEQWLKGSGEEMITVEGFGQTSCDYQIDAGARLIFFLTPDGKRYHLADFGVGLQEAIIRIDDAATITEITGQQPIAPLLISPPAGESGGPAAPNLGLIGGAFLIIGLFGGLFLWRHRGT